MSKEKGGAPAAKSDNVVPMSSGNCSVDKCGKKADRMGFCAEHYMWFKEGLINKKGRRPMDFDKKYQAYLMRKKAA